MVEIYSKILQCALLGSMDDMPINMENIPARACPVIKEMPQAEQQELIFALVGALGLHRTGMLAFPIHVNTPFITGVSTTLLLKSVS